MLTLAGKWEPQFAKEGELICPKKNRYVVFDPRLFHGVLQGRAGMASVFVEPGSTCVSCVT